MSTPSLCGSAEGQGRRAECGSPVVAGGPAAASTPSGGTATSGVAAQPQPPPPASLRSCGLPSCGLAEAAPLDFHVCALCNAVAYCCEAHSAAHWRAGHKRECGGRTPPPLAADSAGSASTPAIGAAAGGGAASASPMAIVVAHPLPPPCPEDGATLRALVEKCAERSALKRHGRAAEVAGQAGDLAFRMYGSDSLVVASLRLHGSISIHNAAVLEPDTGVKTSLFLRARGLLLAAVGVVELRLAAGTLLPGACREVEMQFEAHFQVAICKAEKKPPPSATSLRAASLAMGYDAALHTAYGFLLTVQCLWPATQRLRCQAFVLAALDTIPHTAALVTGLPGSELVLIHYMENDFERMRSRCDPAFYSAVLARWTSPAVVNVLRARGSLQMCVVSMQHVDPESEARRREDVAARGFRRCGLPPCGKLDTTVRHFKLCGGCDAVAYCCNEHHGIHWEVGHHRVCRHLRAAGARPPSTADG